MFLLGLVYAFAFAALANFMLMRAKLRCNEAAMAKVEAYEKLSPEARAAVPLKVVFLHPDLGLGGAERLVVDACIGLQSIQKRCRCEVRIVTSNHQPKRAFPETTDGRLNVSVFGHWLPHSAWGRMVVFFASIRMLYAAFRVCYSFPDTDVVVVDQVPAAMRLLHGVAPYMPCLFYCHFPDQKCDANRNEAGEFTRPNPPYAYRRYREYFDELERTSMEAASKVVCNSQFSRRVTLEVFPNLADRLLEGDVMYPPAPTMTEMKRLASKADPALREQLAGRTVFVSINRYERKKNVELAVTSFFKARKALRGSVPSPILVIAGGYDDRLEENFQCDCLLKHLMEQLSKPTPGTNEAEKKPLVPPPPSPVSPDDLFDSGDVVFLRNISAEDKALLLESATALLYTPLHEHFGIVPLEAMQVGTPPIAVRMGGPLETIGEEEDSAGGLLCEPTPEAFAEAMQRLASDVTLRVKLGRNGQRRVAEVFSLETFSDRLVEELLRLRDEAMQQVKARHLEDPSLVEIAKKVE